MVMVVNNDTNTNALTVNDPRYFECMRVFESGLAKIKLEFVKNLEERDILDQNTLEGLLNVFNQRLVIFQHEYLEFLSRTLGPTKSNVNDYKFSNPDYSMIPELATGILAGGSTAILVSVIPVTTGPWYWTSTVTAASALGAKIGVAGGIVTAALGVAVGAGIGYGINQYMKDSRKKEAKEKLIKYFDEDLKNSLRNWARDRIFEYKNIK